MSNAESQRVYPIEIGKVEMVITVDDRDLEELVRTIYDIPDYRFAAVEECSNHTSHRFDVSTRTVYDPTNACYTHILAQLERVKAGTVPNGCNYVIMQDLVNRGILRPATYLIGVFW